MYNNNVDSKSMVEKDKRYCIGILVLGVVGLLVSLLLELTGVDSSIINRIQSICTGLGVGAICGGLSGIYANNKIQKDPKRLKEIEIARSDERNLYIKSMAEAKSGGICNWLVLALAYVGMVLDAPNWIVFSLIILFLLKYILYIVLSGRYAEKF